MENPSEMARFRAVLSWKRMVRAWLSPSEVNNSREATVFPLNSPKRTKRRPLNWRMVVLPSCRVTDRGSLLFSIGFLGCDSLQERRGFEVWREGVINAPHFRMCSGGLRAEC